MDISNELIQAVDDSKDFDSLVQTYIVCRDAKEELKRAKAEKEKPIDDLMKTLEGKMLGMLDESGQESARTSSGTVYKTKKSRASVADWNVLIGYIKDNDAFDLLTKAVSKDAVKARMTDSQEVVPGVDFVTFVEVGVRRS